MRNADRRPLIQMCPLEWDSSLFRIPAKNKRYVCYNLQTGSRVWGRSGLAAGDTRDTTRQSEKPASTNQNLYRPPSRSKYGLARFRVVASQIWEAIPFEIKCLPFNTFKKEYKRLLLDNHF